MKVPGIILLMEILGVVLISVGAALIFVPAGIITAGISLMIFAIAIERSRAQ